MLDGLENVIISLYAKGMSNSDIEEQIREVYNFEVSTSTISRITDSVSSDIIAWQNRPLEAVYLIVWMDGIVFKVRENSKIINKVTKSKNNYATLTKIQTSMNKKQLMK